MKACRSSPGPSKDWGCDMQLPPLEQFRRSALEAWIDRAIALLDEMDGDPDLEDNGDDEPSIGSLGLVGANGQEYDLELDSSDDEPSLGWTLDGFMGSTFDPDREWDDGGRKPNGRRDGQQLHGGGV